MSSGADFIRSGKLTQESADGVEYQRTAWYVRDDLNGRMLAEK